LTVRGVPVEWRTIRTGVENGKGRDMVNVLSGRFVAVVTSILVVAMLAGCQQAQTPNEKQARLLAAENLQLKERLAGQQTRMETLQKQQAQKIQQQEQELSRCRARVEQLLKDLETGIAERIRDVTAKVIDENARLRKEIERLQAELQKLKADPNQS
jgi:DNA anti-recombination protein RmuC